MLRSAARIALAGGLLLLFGGPLPAQDADVPEVVKTLLQEGDRFRQAGRVDEAIARYEEARRLAPSVVASYVSLGALYHGQGDLEKALEAFAAGLEHDPRQTNLLFNAAVVSLRQGAAADALGFVDRALAEDKREADFHSLRSAVLRELGRLDDALAAQQEAARLDSGNPQVLYRLGNLHFELDQKHEAIDAYLKATRKDKGYLRAWYNLGAVLFDEGRYDEALDAYLVALKPVDRAFSSGENVEASNARAYLNLGAIYFRQESWDAALDAYGKALRLDPEQSVALYNQGYIYYRRGQEDEAFDAYQRALALDPSLPLACLHLGEIHHRRGEAAEAVEMIRRAIGKVSGENLGRAYLVLAEAQLALGKTSSAEEAFRTVLQRDSDNLTALVALGRLLRDKGDVDGSRDFLERARGLAPEHAGVALELAALARAAGDLDREKAFYEEILGRSGKAPERWPVRVNLARVLLEQGQKAAARRTFEPVVERLAELRRSGLDARQGLRLATVHGLLLASEGKIDEARRRLRRVLADDATFVPARDAAAVLDALGGDSGAAAKRLEATLAGHLGKASEGVARANLGQSLWLAGRPREARDHLERAARAFPENTGLHVALGEIAYAEGDFSSALGRLETAVRQCGAGTSGDGSSVPPPRRELRVTLGTPASESLCERARKSAGTVLVSAAYADLGKARTSARDLRSARDRADRALELPLSAGELAVAHLVRGTAQLLMGADRGALSDLARALEGLPAELRLLAENNLGLARYRLGELDAARRRFESARRRGAVPEATLNLGILLDDNAENERALELYEAYLSIGGRRDAEVRAWVERLKRVYR